MPLTPTADPGHHHFEDENIYFYMDNGDQRVRCGISRLALEALEPELPSSKEGRIQAFAGREARGGGGLGQGAVPVTNAEVLYAVAVRDAGDLLVLITIRRACRNVYVNIPRPHIPNWEPHASYHASGQHHQVSFGRKFDVQAHECPDENFRGQRNVVTLMISPTEAHAVNLACDPSQFEQVFEIAQADIAPKGARLAIDLVEPGSGPLTPFLDARCVRQTAFDDSEPWIVVSLWSQIPVG